MNLARSRYVNLKLSNGHWDVNLEPINGHFVLEAQQGREPIGAQPVLPLREVVGLRSGNWCAAPQVGRRGGTHTQRKGGPVKAPLPM